MGIAFSISAAIFFSLSHITVKRGVSVLGVPMGTSIMLFMGTVTTFLIAIIFEGLQILSTASMWGLFYFEVAGTIHFVGGWGFMNASASRIGATRVSAMASLTSLFAAILAFITLNETLNWYVVLGILFITIGIYFTATSRE